MQMLCSLTDGEKLDGKEMPNLDVKYLRGERDFKTQTNGRYVAANSLLILVDGENSGSERRLKVIKVAHSSNYISMKICLQSTSYML